MFLCCESDRILFRHFTRKDAVCLSVQKSNILYNGTGDPSPTVLLFISAFLEKPLAGVVFDILPNLVIISLIADHMVIIGALE